jgi:spermidine/putrescine transport system substrate-binding protein
MIKKFFTLTACFFVAMSCFGSSKQLNIYTWSGYVPTSVIQQFEKKTGIHVNVSTFDNNQVLYAKIKADHNLGYDIVMPSTYIIDRMRKEGMLLPLDKAKVPNRVNINAVFLDQPFDPNNEYSLPYLWGTSGIILNVKKHDPNQFQTWQSLWGSNLKNTLGMPEDMRDNFAIALMTLGYSINDQNAAHLDAAWNKLKTLSTNIKAYIKNGSIGEYVNNEIDIGVVADGDGRKIMAQNSDYQFILPKEGVKIWMDSMVIPKNAPHVDNAYRFMDFVLQISMAEAIANETGFLSPLKPIKKLKGEFGAAVSDETDRQMLKYWEILKSE